jgi:hypothetical protein
MSDTNMSDTNTTDTNTTDTDDPMCTAPDPNDECQTCVYESCDAGDWCECAGDQGCLCTLDCLGESSLLGVVACLVGDCGLQGVNIGNLLNVVGNSVGGLVECNSLTNDGPNSCGLVCPAASLILF